MKTIQSDLVVSFETIEHHDKHEEMMIEIKRVLKADGMLIISSPNKLNYSDRRRYSNQFHVKELYEDEFKILISNHFKHSLFLHQKVLYGSVMLPENASLFQAEYSGDFSNVTRKTDFESLFIVSVASDIGIQNLGVSIFLDEMIFTKNNNIYRNSLSFRLGSFILWPLNFVRKYIR